MVLVQTSDAVLHSLSPVRCHWLYDQTTKFSGSLHSPCQWHFTHCWPLALSRSFWTPMACWPTHSYLCKFPGALLSLFSPPLLPWPPDQPLKLSVFMEASAKHTGLLDPQRRRGLLPSSDICKGVMFKPSLRRLSAILPDEEGQENVSEEGTGKAQVQGHQGPCAEGREVQRGKGACG